ncbi:malto-oligosyltrehalose synthase [Sphingomonas parva]|uniref:Malto-oligosyltrehalose synthase n=1 Tax=Sphingomonas parva TaxID=2555898 RepID=A0A4Y8ZUC1_9SPHN|nr:malto-oligosyltrehalose synthase [Sphingomonas parva]TFI58745.1 malto-oligosyltrehalose synthase [Sphingomonas parva]
MTTPLPPRATYRLQFHAGFTFADALPLVPYLDALGISHVYASPIGTARAGSNHGYDVVDPTRVNPELGGEAGFRALVAALRARGMGLILDIVPNHMAVGGSDNEWWLDLLEKGEASDHAKFFDVDWAPADPALKGKVLAPFLGAPYAEALASGDLVLDQDGRGFAIVAYGTHRFPIRREDQAALLAEGGALARLRALYDGRDPRGRERLHALLERQHWRLAWWRVAGDEINWRRFFEITELAGLRVEDPAVFDAVHALPLRLYAEGLIDGVRIDHVDGLADPGGYCRRLRDALTSAAAARPDDAPKGPAYLVVEKILAEGERLPEEWGTDGTSGYDYMNAAAALLHDARGAEPLGAFWAELSGRPADFAAEEKAARLEILARSFSGQLAAAVSAFHALARSDLATRDVAAGALRRALTFLLSVFPAYRTYGPDAPASDAWIRDRAAARARDEVGPAEAPLVDLVVGWLAGEGPGDRGLMREAVRRFQQLSAPVSAKAVEDTAFYRYGRLLSRTDVGFDPARLAASPEHFAAAGAERLATFPDAMLATATHDHKRGEDVRARLAVLSERPERWIEAAREWLSLVPDEVDRGDAYALLQTLVGAWPLDLDPGDAEGVGAFAERVIAWQTKALREAKLRSSWTQPDEAYEAACAGLVRHLTGPAFAGELHAFVAEIEAAGALNGIAQAVLRCTVPGVPDCYQGTEFWDFSLVDPDNRRPVDFAARVAALERGGDGGWRSGAVKQRAIAGALALRRESPALFARGAFRRVEATGPRAENVFAFLREREGERVLVAVPLHVAEPLKGAGDLRIAPAWWGETTIEVDGLTFSVAELFDEAPWAVRRV